MQVKKFIFFFDRGGGGDHAQRRKKESAHRLGGRYYASRICFTCRMRGRRLGPTSVRRLLGRLSVAPRTCRSFLTAGATQTPILPSSRRTKDTEMCNLIRYSAQRIEGRIRRLRRCRRGHATSPGIGVKPSFCLTRSTSSQVVCSEGARKYNSK